MPRETCRFLTHARTFFSFCLFFAAAALAGSTRFPVIGYFPSWNGADVKRIPFDKLTHINYAFVNPTEAGGLTGVNAKMLRDLSALAHDYGVKISASVGGWKGGNTSNWKTMAVHPASRAEFVRNAVKLCDLYGLDGIDIDWEYPDSSTADDFVVVLKDLAAALHPQGRILSATVDAMGEKHAAFVRPEAFASVDFLNIRAYDWNWAAKNMSHSSYGLADSSLDYWLKRGCPRAKAVLGVPFYGRSYNSENNTYAKYRELVQQDEDAPNKDQSGGYFYNGTQTMARKTELAMKKGGGIMIWEISQDTSGAASLLGAIHRAANPKP
jgi:chitinase